MQIAPWAGLAIMGPRVRGDDVAIACAASCVGKWFRACAPSPLRMRGPRERIPRRRSYRAQIARTGVTLLGVRLGCNTLGPRVRKDDGGCRSRSGLGWRLWRTSLFAPILEPVSNGVRSHPWLRTRVASDISRPPRGATLCRHQPIVLARGPEPGGAPWRCLRGPVRESVAPRAARRPRS